MTWLKWAEASLALPLGCATELQPKKSRVCSKRTKTAGLKKNDFTYCFRSFFNEIPVLVTILYAYIYEAPYVLWSAVCVPEYVQCFLHI